MSLIESTVAACWHGTHATTNSRARANGSLLTSAYTTNLTCSISGARYCVFALILRQTQCRGCCSSLNSDWKHIGRRKTKELAHTSAARYRAMLYLIGLGLYDHKDITLRGLEIIKRCTRVFLEAYTSILLVGVNELEELYGVKVETADREMVESHSDEILKDAADSDVAFCVVGDPFGATTHSDLLLRARQSGIDVAVIHNASIMNAIASCGLQLYRFGQTVSVVFFTETWKPQSFYDKISANKKQKLHTLCLLDIKVKEPTLESLARGKPVYEPPRYMSINTCIHQLLEIEDERQEGITTAETQCVGVARMGAIDEGEQGQLMVSGTMSQLVDVNFGGPLHSFVICGEVDDFEQQMLDLISVECLQAQGKIK